jgi:hypothetical protein
MLMAAAVAFVFYAPALRFGFFNDDPTGHFRWMAGRSVWSFLVDASGHGYYRPLSFVLWQILYTILGKHDPVVLHLLNVLAHVANTALVVWLAQRLSGRLSYATLAGVLFALYPFSYEAVPYVGSFVHPLVTLFVLLTLALYLIWADGRKRWAFIAAHVTLTLAMFTQENAVITPLLIAGLAFSPVLRRQAANTRPAQAGYRARLSFLIEPAAFALVWLIVPKLAEARALSLDSMRANILPFVQSLVYPVTPLANHHAATLALLALLAMAGLTILAWRARVLALLAFGIAVWGLASVPAMLLLDPAYVLGSPRLFYVASVGIALVWALPVLTAGNWYLKIGMWILIFALCYLPSAGYVRCELAYQGMAGEVGQMMADAATSSDAADLTFVNLPYFFSSRGENTECRSPFVFAPTGAVVIPPYADARDFVLYNGGPDRPTLALVAPDYQPGWQTFGVNATADQVRERAGASRVFVFDLLRWRMVDLSAAWRPNGPAGPVKYTLGALNISNVSYQISEGKIETSLTWHVTPAAKDIKIFAHVYDASGKLATQDDGLPADGFVPPAWCKPGDVLTDTRTVALGGLPAGTYRVTAGMYDAMTGARFQARDAAGARLPDDEITVTQLVR